MRSYEYETFLELSMHYKISQYKPYFMSSQQKYEYVSLIFCLSLIFHVFNFILNSQITDLNLSHSQLDSGSLIGSIKVCNTFYSLEWCFHMICEIWKYHLYSCFNVSKKSYCKTLFATTQLEKFFLKFIVSNQDDRLKRCHLFFPNSFSFHLSHGKTFVAWDATICA